MTQIRVGEVVGQLKVVDSDSLLSGPALERIVQAVTQAMAAARVDDQRRAQDVRIGGGCDGGEP